MSDVAHEVELKLRIRAAAARNVLRHPAVAALKHGRARTTKLHSVYYDTPDLRLADAGVAVRLRHTGREWLQTVKGRATSSSAAGLAERVECEWPITRASKRPPLDRDKLAATPYRRTIEKAMRHGALAPVFVTRFERTAVPLRFDDDTTALLCVDVGSIRATPTAGAKVASERIAEIEIELATGNAVRLFDLALTLADGLPVAVETRSKAARGYALVAPKPRRATLAEPIDFRDDATAADAMATILRGCLRQVEANAEGARQSDDPEWVHQMRVGVRRMRCALALLRNAADPAALGPIEQSFRRLADVLGRVRDLDVFGDETLRAIGSATAAAHDADPAMAASLRDLDAQRRARADAARRDVRAAIDSEEFTRLVLSVGRLATAPLLGAAQGTPEAELLAGPARAFASERLAKRDRKLRRAARDVDGSAAQRHALRVQVKKMRYAAEFFAPLFAAKRVRAYGRALSGLQRELGAANDAAVASKIAAQLAPGTTSAAIVAGWASAQRAGDPKRAARAWRAVAEAKRLF